MDNFYILLLGQKLCIISVTLMSRLDIVYLYIFRYENIIFCYKIKNAA